MQDSLRAALPICIGYFPIGLAFGVLAQKAGLSPFSIALMSVLVFAGSAQFIAVSMLSHGAAVVSIILTTFVVNLRHLLMSSSLAVYLHHKPRGLLSLFAYGITDESFAVNIALFRERPWPFQQALLVNHITNVVWVGSTVLGGYAGQFIPEGSFGLEYALVAMFLCLLVFQLRELIHAITAVLAGLISLFLSLWLPGNLHVVLASVLAATLGFALNRYRQKKKFPHALP